MPGGSVAQPAQCEEWDSDESSAIPGTLVQAAQHQRDAKRYHHHQQPSSSRQAKPRDAASDSGYSSLAAKSPVPAPLVIPAQAAVQQQQRPATASPSRTKAKPVIHRVDSARTTTQTQRGQPSSATAAPTRQSRQCSDPNCRDPNCAPIRVSERRNPVPEKQPQQQYQQVPQYQYAQMSQAQAAAMMPPPAIPRPRAASGSRQQRPVSIHGYASMSYNGMPQGPPPSASAYYAYPQPYPQQPQQMQSYLSGTPPTQMAGYPPMSPVPPSPTSPTTTYPGYPGYSGAYSARQPNPAVPGLEKPRTGAAPGVTRTMSARQRPEERTRGPIPGQFPDPESTESETDSETESESSDYSSEEEYRRRKQDPRRHLRTKDVALVHHSRRPSMTKKYYTENTISTSSRRDSMPRESLRRTPRSDSYLDYPSSSDVGDSDRTARAVVDRRSTFSSARSSRRPSVSTTASSGRTKATTLSSMTDYSNGRLVVEGPNGRRTTYLSKEQRDELSRQYRRQQQEDKLEAQRIQEEKVAAYQKTMSGGDPYELTADNIRKASNRKSGSHISGRSQKSSGSSSKVTRNDGIQILHGDTVLHVYGDTNIEMRPSEDGGPAQLVIGSSSRKDSEYRGSSKSSGSRVGRTRGRSELSRRAIKEENDYEDGYEVAR